MSEKEKFARKVRNKLGLLNDESEPVLKLVGEAVEKNHQQANTIKQLEARVGRLEKGLDYAGVKLLEHKDRRGYEYVDKILCEDGPQSLTHIQADAVEKAMNYEFPINEETEYHAWSLSECRKKLKEHANQLRQQADKG